MINYANDVFGINFKKVFVTGDSAGGNLVLALTNMTIQRNFRIPDGIIPIYPWASPSYT